MKLGSRKSVLAALRASCPLARPGICLTILIDKVSDSWTRPTYLPPHTSHTTVATCSWYQLLRANWNGYGRYKGYHKSGLRERARTRMAIHKCWLDTNGHLPENTEPPESGVPFFPLSHLVQNGTGRVLLIIRALLWTKQKQKMSETKTYIKRLMKYVVALAF